MSDDTNAWKPLVSFAGVDYGENTEHAFVHGVEFGMLWQRMQAGTEAEIQMTVHDINRTVIERACAADGWGVTFAPTEPPTPGWLVIKAVKQRAARDNPRGLRVVS